LSGQVQAFESKERSQEEKINRLSEELSLLRKQLQLNNSLPQPQQPTGAGPS
jgi:hypothetical protein